MHTTRIGSYPTPPRSLDPHPNHHQCTQWTVQIDHQHHLGGTGLSLAVVRGDYHQRWGVQSYGLLVDGVRGDDGRHVQHGCDGVDDFC